MSVKHVLKCAELRNDEAIYTWFRNEEKHTAKEKNDVTPQSRRPRGSRPKNQPILTKRHKLSFGGIPHANLCHKCPFRGIPNTLTDGHAEAFGGPICVSKGALVSLTRKLETTRHLELE